MDNISVKKRVVHLDLPWEFCCGKLIVAWEYSEAQNKRNRE